MPLTAVGMWPRRPIGRIRQGTPTRGLGLGCGSSGPSTTAADAYTADWGVCSDFAHIAISVPGTFDPCRSVPSALWWPAAAPLAWAPRRGESGGECVESGGEPFVAVVEPDVFAEGDQGGEAVGGQ
jgi:hypothetical protein